MPNISPSPSPRRVCGIVVCLRPQGKAERKWEKKRKRKSSVASPDHREGTSSAPVVTEALSDASNVNPRKNIPRRHLKTGRWHKPFFSRLCLAGSSDPCPLPSFLCDVCCCLFRHPQTPKLPSIYISRGHGEHECRFHVIRHLQRRHKAGNCTGVHQTRSIDSKRICRNPSAGMTMRLSSHASTVAQHGCYPVLHLAGLCRWRCAGCQSRKNSLQLYHV
ncbi:hypothetical protein V8C44DRAFT_204756 [Trichoderma aethiopicum]